MTSRSRGVRRNLSASSAEEPKISGDTLLPSRTSYRHNKSRWNGIANSRPPRDDSSNRSFSPILTILLLGGSIFVLLDLFAFQRFVVIPRPKSISSETLTPVKPERVIPVEIIQKEESATDDGIIPPSDGDDDSAKERRKKGVISSIFSRPQQPVNDHHQEEQQHQKHRQPPNPLAPSKAYANITVDTTGKKRIMELLRDAGIALTNDVVEKLPTWDQVSALYGDTPVVFGLDQCDRFQKKFGDPAEHFLSTAGTFNTGTNLMAELLIHNCHMPARMKKYGERNRGIRWQVLWGKHTPVGDEEFRLHHRTYTEESLEAKNIFPAVTVRDPYKWMQSVCSLFWMK